MPVKLHVKKASDPSAPDMYVFEEDVISIGRDGANVLTLPDPNRVVSKQHAEIRCHGNAAELVDMGSKNFTYLNGERLEAGRPRALQSGDTIKLGDFELRFEQVAPSYGEDDRTIFDASFVNPFEEDAQRLVEAFNRICQTYEDEPAARRQDALRDAMKAFIVESEPREAKALLAGLLGLEGAAVDPDATSAGRHPSPPPMQAVPERPTAPPRRERARSSAPSAPSQAVTSASASRQEQLLHVLLEAVAKLIAIPAQFRYEFIGQTIMYAPEASFLYEQDADLLARHLLAPNLSQEDVQARLAMLKEALESVAAHQFAMLEGYKAAVKNGAERLVDHLDPSSLVEELKEGQALHRWVPAIAKLEAFDQIRERCRDLRGSDWSVSEQRFYRPEFIRAYLAREAAASPER